MYVGCMGWVLSFLARVLTVYLVMKSGCGIVTDECLSLISEVPLLPLLHLGCSLPGTSKLICLWGLVGWSQYFSFTSLLPREDQRDWQGSRKKGLCSRLLLLSGAHSQAYQGQSWIPEFYSDIYFARLRQWRSVPYRKLFEDKPS